MGQAKRSRMADIWVLLIDLTHGVPLRSSLARGALFGIGAHGAGVSRAREVGSEEGSVAGLLPVRSPLLGESRLISFPRGT